MFSFYLTYTLCLFLHFKTFKRINLMDFEKRIYYRRYVKLSIVSFKKKKKRKTRRSNIFLFKLKIHVTNYSSNNRLK